MNLLNQNIHALFSAKNVASDIATKLCDSVAAKLEGRVLGTFSSKKYIVILHTCQLSEMFLVFKTRDQLFVDIRVPVTIQGKQLSWQEIWKSLEKGDDRLEM